MTLPCGPPGLQPLDAVRAYAEALRGAAAQARAQGRRLQAPGCAADGPGSGVLTGPGDRGEAADGRGRSPLAFKPPPGISAPLLPGLLQRFPYARTLGLHRSSLQHPAFEAAALEALALTCPGLSQLNVYDTLAWDFPQQLRCLAPLTQLTALKLWGLGAPGLDPSAQLAFGRGLMALSGLTRLQELTVRWLFGRQEVVWTCPQTPRLVSALQEGGARLRCLDLNAFLLDRAAAASLARVTSLRSLSLYFDSEGAGWEEVVSLLSLPELTRLVLSYEGDSMTGPWVGDGPPLADDPPQGPGPGPGLQAGPDGGGGPGEAAGHHPHPHGHGQPYLLAAGEHGPGPHGVAAHDPLEPPHALALAYGHGAGAGAGGAGPLAVGSPRLGQGQGQGRPGSGAGGGGGPPSTPRRRLPSWAPRPFTVQYMSLTTTPSLHRLLSRLDVLLPHLAYMSLSSVGEFGPGQRELEAGLMAMAQAGSRLSRMKLFCMELRPELLACITALPCLQELLLFNVWVAADGPLGAGAGQAGGGAGAAAGLGAAAGGGPLGPLGGAGGPLGGGLGGLGAGFEELLPGAMEGVEGVDEGAEPEEWEEGEEEEEAEAAEAEAEAAEAEAEALDPGLQAHGGAGPVAEGPAAAGPAGAEALLGAGPAAPPPAAPGPDLAAPTWRIAAVRSAVQQALALAGAEGGAGAALAPMPALEPPAAAAGAAGPGGGVEGALAAVLQGQLLHVGALEAQIQALLASPHQPQPPHAAGLEAQAVQLAALRVDLQAALAALGAGAVGGGPPPEGAGAGPGPLLPEGHGAAAAAPAGGAAEAPDAGPAAPEGAAGAEALPGAEEEDAPGAGAGPGPGAQPPGPVLAGPEAAAALAAAAVAGVAAGVAAGGGAGVGAEEDAVPALEGDGGGPLPHSVLLRNAYRATAMAQTQLEPLALLGGRLQQLLIEFGPEGSTCFITRGLVRTLEPLAPKLRSLHLLSWNMEGLQLTSLEPLSFSAFTALCSLTIANRISPDSQVNFVPPLPETTGHVIYTGDLPQTLRSLCVNRVNVMAGHPPPPPEPAAGAEQGQAGAQGQAAGAEPGPSTGLGKSHTAPGGAPEAVGPSAMEEGSPLANGGPPPTGNGPLPGPDPSPTPDPSDPPRPAAPNGPIATGGTAAAVAGAGPSSGPASSTTAAASASAPPGSPPLPAPPLLHVWLADCNLRGAPPEALLAALPGLQTLVLRNVSKPEDLPAGLLAAVRGLKDLTTLGLGGFNHRLLPHLHGLTQLRHLMLDPRRVDDLDGEPDWVAVGLEGDRSLAFHEAVMALVAAGGQRLRSVWLPDWAAPPHQMVQWQLQMAQVAPLAALRLVDHHYFWRLPSPVGCPEVQDRLQWWGFDAWNVL
ncbi:hypothetical protein HYH03_018953 [Edaphochlamys debaryana]|uniref:Uncharacterized protein n=1 Tax=Edaphochlamys debaryana TaxID=47281 RepID=A0A836BMT9_9CHLO|nr:hypothetical protein HYH03_018953 [Edaphochlamys debaryana]|eukprot:KAG2482097.1 hypothetical protein HYH03_018953 [Edaphochlamys debaryana]